MLAENLPVSQFEQAVEHEWVAYFPTWHLAHVVDPATIENFPVSHSDHATVDLEAVFAEYVASAHETQSDSCRLPTVLEYLPSSHQTQSSSQRLPVVGKNLPALHSWHVLIS